MTAPDPYAAYLETLKTESASSRRKDHRLPIDAYTASDCEFFFTICARQHGTLFTNPTLAHAVIKDLLWYKNHFAWTMFCYCLMPDHLHFIVQLPLHQVRYMNAGGRGIVPVGILDDVGNFKKHTTTQICWQQGGTGHLWQRSSYDRVIRNNQSVESAVYYVLDNPVRRGLVGQWQDYRYSAVVDEY